MPEPIASLPARRRVPGPARWLRDLLRPTRAQLVLAVVLGLVAMGSVWQMRLRAEDQSFSNLRRDELVALLGQLNKSNDDLRVEIAHQEDLRRQHESGAASRRLAQQQAEQRWSELSILAGTAPAEGPGVTLTITDPGHRVSPALLLDGIEEMRDAGAEVMDLNGVRIVASSWFGGTAGAVTVDGRPIFAPYVLTVIGEPHALSEGAQFRGGLVSQAQAPEVGARVTIATADRLLVTSVHQSATPRFARPV